MSQQIKATKIFYKELYTMSGTTKHFIDVIYNNFLNLASDKSSKHTKEEIKRLLTSQNMFGFLLYNGKILVGYIIGEKINLSDGRLVNYITYLYVAKNYRTCGLGEQLVTLSITKTRNIGLSFIILKCDKFNNSICKFYSKRGFIPDPVLGNTGKHQILTYYL
jgi:ribosomal protein S18 acetylase RimI-like enzyme